MGDKYCPVGEILIRGKAAKITLDGESKDPVKFFCFAEDLKALVDGKFSYVKIYRDTDLSS